MPNQHPPATTLDEAAEVIHEGRVANNSHYCQFTDPRNWCDVWIAAVTDLGYLTDAGILTLQGQKAMGE